MKVVITSEPKELAKGFWDCQMSEGGIVLTQKDQTIEVPVGSDVGYPGKNKFSFAHQGGVVHVIINKMGSYQQRLARDMATWLTNQVPMPDPANYKLEWFYYIFAVLPFGIPIITLGGAIPTGLGVGLGFGNLAIAQKEEWPPATRILACIGLAAAGYIAVFLLLSSLAK